VTAVEASFGQRLLWLLDHYRGTAGMINVPIAWRIRGALQTDALNAAFAALVARHATLRTTYEARGRRLFQVVGNGPAPPIAVHDVRHEPVPEQAALVAMQAEMRTALDPADGPVRATLWRIAADDNLLLVNVHHLATDFFSNMILTRDLAWLYDRAVGATSDELPAVGWSYGEWAQWQREAFAAGRLERLQAFWKDQLDGARLPQLRGGAGEDAADRGPGRVTHDLQAGVVERLRGVARAQRTTMFPVMLAAFYAHLHRLTGQRDLAVASLFTNRGRPEVQQTVGFFVNMIVLRGEVDPEAPFAQLIRACRSTFMKALAHCDLPFQMLPPRTLETARADDVVIQYLEAPPSPASSLDFTALDLPVAVDAGRFALELVVFNQEHFMLRFDGDFTHAWARDFLAGYAAVLTAIADGDEASRAVAAVAG
jgi:hypothetical protein